MKKKIFKIDFCVDYDDDFEEYLSQTWAGVCEDNYTQTAFEKVAESMAKDCLGYYTAYKLSKTYEPSLAAFILSALQDTTSTAYEQIHKQLKQFAMELIESNWLKETGSFELEEDGYYG